MAILSLKNIKKNFGGLKVLSEISFEIVQGTINALIGPNGAGKTTLVNIVNGLLRPDDGEIFFNGEKIDNLPSHQIAERQVSRTFQILKVFSELSVLENLMIGGHVVNKAGMLENLTRTANARLQERKCRSNAWEILESLDLGDQANRLMGELPHGQQRLIDLGRALMSKPKLLLLDEPCCGLSRNETGDLKNRMEIIKKSGVTILIVEHNMPLIMNVADRIIAINNGVVIANGPPESVRQNPAVIDAYLGRKNRHAQD